jgi:hypothetical protein
MGKTLFGSFVAQLRDGGAGEASRGSADLSRIYSPVRKSAKSLAARLGRAAA